MPLAGILSALVSLLSEVDSAPLSRQYSCCGSFLLSGTPVNAYVAFKRFDFLHSQRRGVAIFRPGLLSVSAFIEPIVCLPGFCVRGFWDGGISHAVICSPKRFVCLNPREKKR